ncbi:MAG: tetratricopeptide repeat protein [Bacillota bacterium]|nr:tetratricopeptide repeat protein [Bacillota bacterium]
MSKQRLRLRSQGIVAIVVVFALIFGLVALFGGMLSRTERPELAGEAAYRARLAATPQDFQTLVNLGNLHYDRGQYAEAITYYEQALALNPDDVNVLVDTGTAYFYRQPSDPDRALAYYQRALERAPTFPNALYNKGIVLWQGKGDLLAARRAFEEFLRVQPSGPNAAAARQIIEEIDRNLPLAGKGSGSKN